MYIYVYTIYTRVSLSLYIYIYIYIHLFFNLFVHIHIRMRIRDATDAVERSATSCPQASARRGPHPRLSVSSCLLSVSSCLLLSPPLESPRVSSCLLLSPLVSSCLLRLLLSLFACRRHLHLPGASGYL